MLPHCGYIIGLCYRLLGHPTVTLTRQFMVEVHAVGSLHSLHLCCCGPFVDVPIAIGWLMTEAGDIFWLSYFSSCWFGDSSMAAALSWALIYIMGKSSHFLYTPICAFLYLYHLYLRHSCPLSSNIFLSTSQINRIGLCHCFQICMYDVWCMMYNFI